MTHEPPPEGWGEATSQTFIDYGRYFVPEREEQIAAFCDLIAPPAPNDPFTVVELCCGEGLLAAAILEHYPHAMVHGFDASPIMLARAETHLAAYKERFVTHIFDIADSSWRTPDFPIHAVVSSLAIHHLDGTQKQALFADVLRMLQPLGMFVVADVVAPASDAGWLLAARQWDDAVKKRSVQIDGDERGFILFQQEQWNMYRHAPAPDDLDKPSSVFDQLTWLAAAGFTEVDVYWMQAGHALFGGRKSKEIT